MTPDQLREWARMIEYKGTLPAKVTAEHYRAHAAALEEIEKLKEDLTISRHCHAKMVERAENAERRAERLQSKVDSLMLEYCPDEMTPEQLAEWEKHQRAVPAEFKGE